MVTRCKKKLCSEGTEPSVWQIDTPSHGIQYSHVGLQYVSRLTAVARLREAEHAAAVRPIAIKAGDTLAVLTLNNISD